MRRILRDGDTYKAFVERNGALESTVKEIVEALRPFGACNIQLRVSKGRPFVFEFNARCSGTTAARALAGFNEPQMIADYVLKGIAPSYAIEEISILRYWKELVVPNSAIRQLESNYDGGPQRNAGKHSGDRRGWLHRQTRRDGFGRPRRSGGGAAAPNGIAAGYPRTLPPCDLRRHLRPGCPGARAGSD
jgi:hypothetical protein